MFLLDWLARAPGGLEWLHKLLMGVGPMPRVYLAAGLAAWVVILEVRKWEDVDTISAFVTHCLNAVLVLFAGIWLYTHDQHGDVWVVLALLSAALVSFLSGLQSMEAQKRWRALFAGVAMLAAGTAGFIYAHALYPTGRLAYFADGSEHVNWVAAAALLPLVLIAAGWSLFWLVRWFFLSVRRWRANRRRRRAAEAAAAATA